MKIEIERLRDFFEDFSQNRAAVFGLMILSIIIISMIFFPIILNRDPFAFGKSGDLFRSPELRFPFGTDDLGRDLFTRVMYGIQISLLVGILVSLISTLIGITIGSISGYVGGSTDDLLMRITESIMVMPRFFLALVIVAVIGPSIWNVILVLSILGWPATARLTRAEFLSLKEREFVLAAKSIGSNTGDIIFNEILPNASPPIIVNSSLQVGMAILMESGLSFLGLGDPNLITLGTMLRLSQPFLRSAWWMAVFPGLTIFLIVLSLNLIGDGLNDALNPRLRKG